MALLDEKGAGKSTLLKTVGGLIPSTGGSICLNGADLTRTSAPRAHQPRALLPPGRPRHHGTGELGPSGRQREEGEGDRRRVGNVSDSRKRLN